MSQIYHRANLSDAQFPLISTFQGKTVIQPTIDQNYTSPPIGSKEDRDKGIPEALYLHNVMPSMYGYKSIAYNELVPAVPAETSFARIFPVKDFDGNRGHVAITNGGKTYLITSLVPEWKNVTPSGQPAGVNVTAADATGTSFICYDSFGIFTVDLVARTINPATLQWDSPITNASIVGIASSNNYLLAHDGTNIYWSSALSVLDFRASQITGAGNGVPTGAKGAIVTIAPVGIGFAVYCQGSIVVATYSGNVQYPWLFKEAPNGSGVASVYHVTASGEEGSNYAWTSAGLLRVTLSGCAAIHPEVSDFLSGRLIEDYDYASDTSTITRLTSPMQVRLAFSSSRYLVISYGPSLLNYALVHDISLNRWGKLKQQHVQAFDISFNLAASGPSYLTFADTFPNTFADYALIEFTGETLAFSSVAAEAKHSLCFLQANGAVNVVNFEYPATNSEAVLILGKYQLVRAKTVGVQGFTLETIDDDNTNFNVRLLTSLDGKNTSFEKVPFETVVENMRQYDVLSIGANHSIRIKGAFHLVGFLLVFTIESNR